MKTGRSFLIFILCLAAFVISLRLFWNMSLFADSLNTSPASIDGGRLWLYMDWLRLALLGLASLVSGAEFIRRLYISCKLTFSFYLVRLMKHWADME